jgi:hypothetical protein
MIIKHRHIQQDIDIRNVKTKEIEYPKINSKQIPILFLNTTKLLHVYFQNTTHKIKKTTLFYFSPHPLAIPAKAGISVSNP